MCDIEKSYVVEGMTCASCATKVSNAVADVRGVTATNVDIANGVLTVAGNVDDAEIRAAITAIDYKVKSDA